MASLTFVVCFTTWQGPVRATDASVLASPWCATVPTRRQVRVVPAPYCRAVGTRRVALLRGVDQLYADAQAWNVMGASLGGPPITIKVYEMIHTHTLFEGRVWSVLNPCLENIEVLKV